MPPAYLLDDKADEPRTLPAYAEIGNAIARREGELTDAERFALIRMLARAEKKTDDAGRKADMKQEKEDF